MGKHEDIAIRLYNELHLTDYYKAIMAAVEIIDSCCDRRTGKRNPRMPEDVAQVVYDLTVSKVADEFGRTHDEVFADVQVMNTYRSCLYPMYSRMVKAMYLAHVERQGIDNIEQDLPSIARLYNVDTATLKQDIA